MRPLFFDTECVTMDADEQRRAPTLQQGVGAYYCQGWLQRWLRIQAQIRGGSADVLLLPGELRTLRGSDRLDLTVAVNIDDFFVFDVDDQILRAVTVEILKPQQHWCLVLI